MDPLCDNPTNVSSEGSMKKPAHRTVEGSSDKDRGSDPAISVLVPIYNVEKYLSECLESIRKQSFTDFEVICINDGSTDSSKDIIDEFVAVDSRFKILDKPNSGYGASMNMGLDKACGEYIAILESDDIFMLDALENLYRAARSFNVPVVKGDFNLYWSKPVERTEPSEELGFVSPLGSMVFHPIELPQIFYAKSSIWSALYLRSFLVENDIRFLETPGASYQDTSFNFKVWASANEAALIGKTILNYRQDNESSSVNSPAKVYCICDEYAEISKWVKKDRRPELEGIMQRAKYNNYLWNYDRLSDSLRDDFLQRFSNEFREAYEGEHLDMDRFEPWAEADLLALMDSPERFQRCRDDVGSPGKLNTFKHYFRLGGLPLVMKVLKYKKDNR